MADGPNKVRQITLSIGFTQYGGNLAKVLQRYANNAAARYPELGRYVSLMRHPTLVNDKKFRDLLATAGRNDPLMGEVQEEMFNELYMEPAIRWGENEGMTLPYSFLIICDSFLHSGSILGSIRKMFGEKTPKNGGREKVWIAEYIDARHRWLTNHGNSLVRTSSYRTRYYLLLLALNDWYLDATHTIAMNGIKPLQIV
jgi:chitosanase